MKAAERIKPVHIGRRVRRQPRRDARGHDHSTLSAQAILSPALGADGLRSVVPGAERPAIVANRKRATFVVELWRERCVAMDAARLEAVHMDAKLAPVALHRLRHIAAPT